MALPLPPLAADNPHLACTPPAAPVTTYAA